MSRDPAYLEAAADRAHIADLVGRYAFAIDYDTHDPGAWAALFTSDGRFEIPIARVVVAGQDELTVFAAGLQRTLPGLHHVMSNLVVDLDGERARGRCQLNEFMVRDEAIYSIVQGWYEDDYRLTAAGWRFERRQVFVSRASSRVSTSGVIGEYTRAYFEFCRGYRRE